MSRLDVLQKEIHANAVEKGWWPSNRTWSEVRILIVSEIAEALEEFRAGRMGIWYDGKPLHEVMVSGGVETAPPPKPQKPEGFGIELADAAIRMLDYQGRLGRSVPQRHFMGVTPSAVPDGLDAAVAALYSSDRHGEPSCDEFQLCRAWSVIQDIADMNGIDLDYCMEIKHAYNRTRPFRHGGKAA